MNGELHDGVVAFTRLASGREAVMLGRVQVGEISPIGAGDNRACFRLTLPEAGLQSWRPAADGETARRQIIERINDWLNAAGLTPAGVMAAAIGATSSSPPARAARKDGTS